MLESSVRHRFQSAKELLQALALEPQMQQLAESIAATPPTPRSRMSQPASSGNFVSPAARSAVAIRSQQARNDSMAGGYRRPGAGGAGVRNSYNPRTGPGNDLYSGDISGGQSQLVTRTGNIKFDAPRLMAAYKKGRRDFTSQVLNNLVLRQANLPEAIFHQAQMQNVDLQQANLYNSNLGRASLAKANLRDANLTKAYLSYADLSGTDLRGANLTDAYLNNANLRGANLCGANLLGASITEDQLAQAHINFRTTLPNGRRVMKL
jgi:serine/threonine protein kinase, bacterial